MIRNQQFFRPSHWKARASVASVLGVFAMMMSSVSPASAASTNGRGFHVMDRNPSDPAYPGDPITTLAPIWEGCAKYKLPGRFTLAFPTGTGAPNVATIEFKLRTGEVLYEGPSGTYDGTLVAEVDPSASGGVGGCKRSKAGQTPIDIEFTSVKITSSTDLDCQVNGSTPTGLFGTIERGVPIISFPSGVISEIPLDSMYTIKDLPCEAGLHRLTAYVAAEPVSTTVAVTPPCFPPIMSQSCTLHRATLY